MVLTIGMHRNGNKTASIALYDMSFTDVGDYGRLARDLYIGSYDPKRPCAFSTVAEGYGPSSEEPLVLFVFGRQTSSRDDVWGEVANNIDLKVNSLSVTVLPRSIEDVLCFVSRKWSCRNSNLEVKSVVTRLKSSQKITDGPTASANETLRFKFVAVYPRLILLADETDPYSRALVLRGLAVGNMSIIRDTSSSLYKYGQVDMRGSTSLSGHIKELETYVHNNIDSLIGPDRSLSDDDSIGVALVEPVTVTVEVRIESRSRFPTSRYVSIDIEPVAILLSFGDLSLINAISRKSFRKQKEMSKKNDLESQTRLHSPSVSSQVCSPQFSNSSDYSQCEEMQLVFDVAIVTKRLGLHLRKSGSSIIVESSQCNDKVESGDILLAVNGQSVERMPLASVVNLFDNIPRPLTITLSRQVRHQSSATNDISTKTSDSYAIDAHSFHVSSSDEVGKDVELDTSVPGMITTRFDVNICGIPTGLELKSGLGGTAVVNNVDYELFARCAPSISAINTATVSSMLACRQWPLPGALLLAIDGKEMNFEEISNVLDANEKSVEEDSSFTFSFVEADSIGNISNFEGRMSFVLTVIDDTNGRDMPVLRAGLHDTSFTANHGLATATKSIVARRPAILSVCESSVFEEDEAAVLTLESKVLSFNLDFNNAIVNEWEPLIEPHCLAATIERQSGNPRSPGQCSFVIRDQIDCSEHGPLEFVCVNVSPLLTFLFV